MVQLTFHGHSCFEITDGQNNLVIDPYITGNPVAKVKPSDILAHYIIVSHGHADHWGDTETIAKANHAMVITNFELTKHAANQGCMIHPLHIGGKADFPFGWVKLTIAHHGSSFGEADDYGGNPAGVLLNIGGKTIYHAGDTGLFMDMKLIGEMNSIDLALLPIGDNFTMGPIDAAKAVEFLRPKKVVPMHYNTFDLIKQDPNEFAKLARAQGVECVIMASGDKLDI
jgi:L-ascorbate metabolism protein UlaG (beta-lactamase superfamily)